MTVSNIFSKATRPVETKFHVEYLGAEGTLFCSNHPGHMTNMASKPIYGKNILKSLIPEPFD